METTIYTVEKPVKKNVRPVKSSLPARVLKSLLKISRDLTLDIFKSMALFFIHLTIFIITSFVIIKHFNETLANSTHDNLSIIGIFMLILLWGTIGYLILPIKKRIHL